MSESSTARWEDMLGALGWNRRLPHHMRFLPLAAAVALTLGSAAAHAQPFTPTVDRNATTQLVDICRTTFQKAGEPEGEAPCYYVTLTRGGGTINVWFETDRNNGFGYVIDASAPPYTDGDLRVAAAYLVGGGKPHELQLSGEGLCSLSPARGEMQHLVCVVTLQNASGKAHLTGSAIVPPDFRIR